MWFKNRRAKVKQTEKRQQGRTDLISSARSQTHRKTESNGRSTAGLAHSTTSTETITTTGQEVNAPQMMFPDSGDNSINASVRLLSTSTSVTATPSPPVTPGSPVSCSYGHYQRERTYATTTFNWDESVQYGHNYHYPGAYNTSYNGQGHGAQMGTYHHNNGAGAAFYPMGVATGYGYNHTDQGDEPYSYMPG